MIICIYMIYHIYHKYDESSKFFFQIVAEQNTTKLFIIKKNFLYCFIIIEIIKLNKFKYRY